MDKYIIEVRNEQGQFDLEKEAQLRKEHSYLFLHPTYSLDDLCRYASYGQGRNNPVGPIGLGAFMKEIGISYRIKYW